MARLARDRIDAALAAGNMVAFLRVIRAGEGTAGEDGFRTLYGGGTFDAPPWRHPRRAVTAGRWTSTAAGAFQILAGTEDDLVRLYGFDPDDFGPREQEARAVALIHRRGALEDVLAGRFEAAIAKCAREWASLPGSPYGQPTITLARALRVYAQWGGALEQPVPGVWVDIDTRKPIDAAPPFNPDSLATEHYGEAVFESTVQKEDTMPAPILALAGKSLAWGLASSLIDAFTPLAREKITKEIGRHADRPEVGEKIADSLIAAAKSMTGVADPIDAVAQARQVPEQLQRLEAHALEEIEKLGPILDKIAALDREAWAAEEASRDAATRRAAQEPHDQDPFLTRSVVFGAFGILALAAALAAVLAVYGKSTGELVGLITTGAGLIFGAFKTRIDHRYGSSRSSGAKDVVISELAARRPAAPLARKESPQ